MAILSSIPELTPAKLTAEQILTRMPNSSADELQGIHDEWQSACHCLQRIEGGQLLRLLGDEALASLKQTHHGLKQALPLLAKAITARIHHESGENTVRQTLSQVFGALTQIHHGQPKPNHQALLQVMRWMLIAETELHFSWLLTPAGNLEFFEQEQPRLLRYLTQYVLETIEQNSDYPFIQVMEVAIKQLREILSRPLNKTEAVAFKRIQEELSVELSGNVVRLNTTRKQIKQGENP